MDLGECSVNICTQGNNKDTIRDELRESNKALQVGPREADTPKVSIMTTIFVFVAGQTRITNLKTFRDQAGLINA